MNNQAKQLPAQIFKGTSKTGTAISRAGSKTVIVRVDSYITHPLYKKKIRTTRRFAVHDEQDTVKVGDRVVIGETRPVSKTKHWKIIQIIGKKL
ncbi:30S ribosomal protein S17 [candidate division Kazan bacterium]|uniref:Small ribosomal subunit protein uS17 n=1 Tax=candidate division Kazan bacterium TaxID=2202143 RepID=A0A420ZE14_UNCK3|nr:MAG: 30S ribosomal protein S17 [candidate division Kazan bacterium]